VPISDKPRTDDLEIVVQVCTAAQKTAGKSGCDIDFTIPGRDVDDPGRGLHSSTFQFNLSRFCLKIPPEHPLIPPQHPLRQPPNAPPIPQKALTLSRKVDECKLLDPGINNDLYRYYIMTEPAAGTLTLANSGSDAESDGLGASRYGQNPAYFEVTDDQLGDLAVTELSFTYRVGRCRLKRLEICAHHVHLVDRCCRPLT